MRISPVWLFLLVCLLATVGCRSREPADSTFPRPTDESTGSSIASVVTDADQVERVGPTAEQQQAIAMIIEMGGRVDCDAYGLPALIDLASDRVFADERVVQAVFEFPKLEKLRLAVSGVDPATLTRLTTLTELNELMLQDAAITDRDLAALVGSLTHLKRLTLRRLSQVTDAGVASVAGASQMEVLGLIEMNQVTGTALEHLQRMDRLRSLDLRACGQFVGADFLKLKSFQQLSELKLAGSAIDDKVLHTVAQLPVLSALTIEDAGITGEGLQALAASAELAIRLRSLSFARCFGITDKTLAVLPGFPSLQTLSLRDIMLTGSFLNVLNESGTQLPALRTLIINDAFLTDESILVLPQIAPHLERLDLRRNPGLTEPSPDVLKQLRSLKQLQRDGSDSFGS